MSSDNEAFGLSVSDLQQIISVFKAFPEIEQALIFGSRAKGTYKKGSDIDIALIGQNLDTIVTAISYQLNQELLLPYFFDVVDYNSISHLDLKAHIDRVGKTIYTKN